MRFASLLLVVTLVSLSAGAAAQQSPRIDPRIARRLAHPLPSTAGAPPMRSSDGVGVVVELVPGATVRDVEQLGGVTVSRVSSRPLAWGPFVAATVDARGLAALAASPRVARVSVAPTGARRPLDRSAELVSLAAARGAGPRPYTGAGVLIADLDTIIDIHHPTFFHADAGWYDWIDVDGDHRFHAGTDAIDLDGDGVAGPGETASLLPASPTDLFGLGDPSSLRHGVFDPSIDWVYLDLDGNGRRDRGLAAGFDESTPAYGEPVLVPDDVDGDGQIDPEERFVRLGTSKIRAAFVNVDRPIPFRTELRRGVDLISLREDYTEASYGYADTLHGSGVVGILVADVPLTHRRWVGMAPDADVVLSFDNARTDEGLMWALGERPDVMLHEYVEWVRIELDGGDPTSALIDASTAADHVTHVCPAGNIGSEGKHARFAVPAGGHVSVSFEMPPSTRGLDMTLHHLATVGATYTVIEPGGATHTLPDEMLSDGGYFTWESSTTTRGWDVHSYTMYEYDPLVPTRALPSGRWTLRVDGDPAAATTIEAFLSDWESGFGYGAAWDTGVTNAGTIGYPATADACLAVGAVPSHLRSEGPWYYEPGGAGFVREYSARGPRIDGLHTIGIVAPDDPWSALGQGEVFPSTPGRAVAPPAAFQVFGGTSGAGPHVAGVAALLVQAGMHAPEVRAAIENGAVHDAMTGAVPNDDYGFGRLSAAGAFGVSPDGTAPTVTLVATPSLARPGTMVRLVAAVTDPDGTDGATLSWDDGYDGTWEVEGAPLDPRSVTLDHEGTLRVKVRARDASGRVGEAAVLVTFSETAPEWDAGVPDAGASGDASADGGGGGGGGGCCGVAGGADTSRGAIGALLVLGACALRARRRSSAPRRRR